MEIILQLTKNTHAYLDIKHDDGSRLIIDPGAFNKLPDDLTKVVAVVVTEEHMDHFHQANLEQIRAQNPNATIFTTQAVHDILQFANIVSQAVIDTQEVQVGPFKLKFYPSDHAPVYRDSPCRSLPVKVDNYLYYPSDTYHVIADEVEILALPTSGPWHKLSEAIDFANASVSKKIVPTHNGMYSDTGNFIANQMISSLISAKTREWIYLEDGQPL